VKCKAESEVVLVDQSVTPVLLTEKSGFEKVGYIHLYLMMLPQSQTCFFGGSADGTDFAKKLRTYTFLVNHEQLLCF
jgi:hypothetical protein